MLLTPEGEVKARAAFDEATRRTDEQVKNCQYCKAAKTRSRGKKTECKRHREQYRLNYVCSPISETYWSS
jgi:hypothetical protein